jgi:hypothetical protein
MHQFHVHVLPKSQFKICYDDSDDDDDDDDDDSDYNNLAPPLGDLLYSSTCNIDPHPSDEEEEEDDDDCT